MLLGVFGFSPQITFALSHNLPKYGVNRRVEVFTGTKSMREHEILYFRCGRPCFFGFPKGVYGIQCGFCYTSVVVPVRL